MSLSPDSKFLPRGRLERRLQSMRLHMVDTRQLPSMQRTDTKLLAHMPFLQLLRQQGHERATHWLGEHRQMIGKRTSVDFKTWLA